MSGNWDGVQNKVLPGVYIRFNSKAGNSLEVGDRGIVTICEPLSWGPVAQVMEISAGADTTAYTGYDITNEKNLFLNEIFKGTNRTKAPQKVLLYRPTASGSASASATIGSLTATAKYPGVRGNDITIVVTALTEPENAFSVLTVVDGDTKDTQIVKTIADIKNNDWVDFSGTGELEGSAGEPLVGGLDGAVATAAYTAYLNAIEPYRFDVIVYDGTDTTVESAMEAFVKRIVEESGIWAQLVTSNGTSPDSQYVINVKSGVTLGNGKTLTAAKCTWWVGGACAGASYNEDLTYATYPGAVAVSPLLTISKKEEAALNGQFIFFEDNGTVKAQYDINSLKTYTPDTGKVFRYNRTMRLCSTIANDIRRQFEESFIGTVNNNDTGRSQFKAAIVGYLLDIQATGGIQNFTADDVTVAPGSDIDAIVVNIAIQVVGSVNKIYLTVEVS